MAEALPGDTVKILVAVADVDALVKKGSAIDESRSPQYDLGVYRGHDIPDAA